MKINLSIALVLILLLAGTVPAQDTPSLTNSVTNVWVTATNMERRWGRVSTPVEKEEGGPLYHLDSHPFNYQLQVETTVVSNLVQITVYHGVTNKPVILDTVLVSKITNIYAFTKVQ